MFICFIYAWKTRLWARVIDLELFLFSEIIVVRMSDKHSNSKREFILGAITMSLVKRLLIENTSPSYPIILALICSTFLLLYTIFILAYWSFLSNRLISISNSLIQVVSFAIRVNITYLASIKNKAIITYLLEYQLIKFLFSIKTNLNVDFLIVLWLA